MAASVRTVSVLSARIVSRVAFLFFPAVRIPAVPVSAFSTAAFLFDSETAVSVFRVSGVS